MEISRPENRGELIMSRDSDLRLRSRSSVRLGVLSLLLTMLCFAPHASAQSTGGRICGPLTKTTGAPISGAALGRTDKATNVTRSTVSGSNGEYIFLEIPVGTYDLSVTQQGFKRYERKGVT